MIYALCRVEYCKKAKTMMRSEQIIENFKQLYNKLNRDTATLELLERVYAENIQFEDCFHNIKGIKSLFEYFDNLYENVEFIGFDFKNQWLNENSAMLTWTMSYKHPKLNGGQLIAVEGASQLDFNHGKVIRHRDYFDGGALLYENIPILKRVIFFLKNRLA
jgi:hypothetical protein